MMACLVVASPDAESWDHPGHMVTAAIAFAGIERERPDLIEKIGLLFLSHPDPAPFWVAAGEAKGLERARRMFIECARWADDSKFTNNDRLTWHTARWPIIADDAPPEAAAAIAARNGRPVGQALEALALHQAMLANHESTESDRALALCWVLHIVGDLHQPMHVSDLYSAEYPAGNAAATLSYVADPLSDTTIPLHLLWDSNVLRNPALAEVDRQAERLMRKYPRSALPELQDNPLEQSRVFEAWARESHQIAVDWAYDIDTVADTQEQDSEKLVQNMINFILNGISPVEVAPEVPEDYWNRLATMAERRITLAGYRIADLVLAAADDIEAERSFVGR
jgi:hypothetical protein